MRRSRRRQGEKMKELQRRRRCQEQECANPPHYVLFCSDMFCSVLFCYVVLSCAALFCSIMFCPVLSCSALSCPVLFCPVLSSPVLLCSVVPYLTQPNQHKLTPQHHNTTQLQPSGRLTVPRTPPTPLRPVARPVARLARPGPSLDERAKRAGRALYPATHQPRRDPWRVPWRAPWRVPWHVPGHRSTSERSEFVECVTRTPPTPPVLWLNSGSTV
eukprot:gene9816-biopygen21266